MLKFRGFQGSLFSVQVYLDGGLVNGLQLTNGFITDQSISRRVQIILENLGSVFPKVTNVLFTCKKLKSETFFLSK